MTGRDVNDNDVVRIDDVLISTPARVSCIVSSDRSEETEITRFHLKPCLESIPPLEESRDRLGAYPGRREAEVRRIQEMADLGPRWTRTRGSQDVTATDKSKVGPAIRGPRASGRVRPSDSPTISPVARIVLVMLCWIFHVAGRGTSPRAGAVRDITNCNENWTHLYSLLCSECISSCNIVPGQLTIVAIVFECIFVCFTLIN